MGRSFHLWSIGCQMNLADSESLSRQLLAAGFNEESELERADVAILNTCVVRQASEDKVYAKLHELRSWKTEGRTIALTGCLVGKEGEQLKSRFPQLDAVLPIGKYQPFIEQLQTRYDVSQGESLPAAGRTKVSHYINIVQGCDHNCTFCIVPKVRGREVHRPSSQVLDECQAAIADGAREVVLLGQNVDDYQDPEGNGGLSSLVRRVADLEGLIRVRFMTSHPQDLEPELLELMAEHPKVAHELQLPIQSGDDLMLKRMARGYQVRHYREIVQRARQLMPDLGLYTDIIVGFCGETEEMFQNTRRLMEEVEFDVVHLAQYSPRPGTISAERWADDVPAEVKRERINQLIELQRGIAARRTASWVGRQAEVLVEGVDEIGQPYGRNRQGKRTVVQGAQLGLRRPSLPLAGQPMRPTVALGELVRVEVSAATPGQLIGNLAGFADS